MTGVRGVLVETRRGPGVGAEGGGRDPGAEAGGGQHQGLGPEAEGQGAEEEEGQGATAESVILGAGAETPSQAVIRDPSLGAGVELRGLLTAFIETQNIFQIVIFSVLKTPKFLPTDKKIVFCEI